MPAPKNYECKKCGARGVKLWRQWSTMPVHITLLCRTCAEHIQRDAIADRLRRYGGDFGPSDQIGDMCPAVPTKMPVGRGWRLPNGYSFWGYTSVPPEAVAWWRSLHGEGLSGKEVK